MLEVTPLNMGTFINIIDTIKYGKSDYVSFDLKYGNSYISNIKYENSYCIDTVEIWELFFCFQEVATHWKSLVFSIEMEFIKQTYYNI